MARESSNIGWFLCELARIPALTDEEEQKLRGRIRAGDDRARQRLIEGTLLFAFFLARRQARMTGGRFLHDFVSEANLALTQLGRGFDPDHPFPFKSCAYFRIRQALTRARQRLTHTVRVPDAFQKLEREQLRARRTLRQRLRREPTRGELARELEVPLDRLEEAPGFRGAPLELDDPGVAGLTDPGPTPEELSIEDSSADAIRSALDHLEPPQRQTLELHFGLSTGGAKTYTEIAAVRGVSRQRAHQQCQSALRRLGQVLRQAGRAAAM